jgi:uncharacterized protein (DUF2147 family)
MQKSNNLLLATLALACLGAASPASAQTMADILGNYTRPNGDSVLVADCNGLLCGHLTSGNKTGMEMLHGMESATPGEWRGNRMKHPSMPGFMTFNGTVTVVEGNLSVRGCAIGEAFCDAEIWTRQP